MNTSTMNSGAMSVHYTPDKPKDVILQAVDSVETLFAFIFCLSI
jgi:hypothetical protein